MYFGKHYFHLKEYSILQLLYAGTELNTHSDGNGITGTPSVVFLTGWEIKRRKIYATRRSCTLSHFSNANFEKFLMTAKAVCLRIKVAQLKSFGWKTTGILQYLEVFYILF